MTADEVKALIDAGKIEPRADDVIGTFELISATSSATCDANLHLGWDIAKAWACDRTWGVFNVQLMRFIGANFIGDRRKEILAQVQVDDAHWRWFDKSVHYRTDEYVWFFLYAEGYPQGACLLFHPKEPAFGSGKIFYIEYVAAAPWNRVNPMSPRSFRGVGSALIRGAAQYATDVLGLSPGFCLHALPKAVKFYQDIGMQPYPARDKAPLPYFEMTEESFHSFMGSA